MKQVEIRRGAVHPGVILAFVVFLGMMAWALIVNWNAIDPRVLGNHGLRSRAVGSTVSMTLLLLAVCGGVTALVYFVSAKSMQVANNVLMVLLLLSCVFPARRLYLLWDAIDRRAQLAAGVKPDASGSGPNGGSTSGSEIGNGSGGNVYVVPRPANPTPQPWNPVVAPAGGVQPGGSSPGGSTPSAAAPVIAPPPPALAFDGKPVLDKLRAEYAAKCEALAVKAEAAYVAAAKPKKVNQYLNDSIETFNTLKAEAEVLEAELQELNFRGAREALEKAGAPLGDAARQAMAFDEEFNTFQRQVACGELSRFAEKAAELFTIINDNFAKVQIDGKGEATSKERAVETELFHVRARVRFAVERKEETLKKVRGKE